MEMTIEQFEEEYYGKIRAWIELYDDPRDGNSWSRAVEAVSDMEGITIISEGG